MLHHFTTAYPAWYVEGFAEFLSTAEFKENKANIGLQAKHRVYQLYLEETTPIRKLLSSSVSEVDRDQRGNFYGRAWLLTHFLTFKSERKGQLERYLALVSKGTPSLEAAEATFGDLNVLQRDLQRYMEARSINYLGISSPPPSVKGFIVTEMEPAFGETLRERLSLNRSMDADERQRMIRSLEKAVLTYPKSAAVWTLLAEAKLDAKDYKGAKVAGDTAISIDPQTPRANLWRGLARLRELQDMGSDNAAAWKEARGWLVRANRADPEDALILFEYYRSFGRERRLPSAAAIAGLRKATLKIPQAFGFRSAYAFELVKSGEYGQAADYLQPLANSPHGGESTKKLQAAVSKLRAAAADKSQRLQPSDFVDELGSEATDL
jgi:tetratricopeptide (TPR) repeat protein